MRASVVVFLVVGLAAWLSSTASGQSLSGYDADSVTLAPGSSFVGGLDVLPSGNYLIFDGVSVVEIQAGTGAQVRTLYTPKSSVFGAFVTLDPSATFAYFGESSLGDIVEIDVATLSARRVANASLPFDLAFDAAGEAYLSWSPGFGLGSVVSHLDLASGAMDDVVLSPEASSPIVFHSNGDLFLTTPDSSMWPPPLDTTEVYRLSAAQVQGALGPATLLPTDGILLALVDGAYGLAVDESGDLFVTDPTYHKVTEIDAETGVERVLWDSFDMEGLTYVRYVPSGQGAFEWYQPQGSGTLVMADTDYWSYNQALRLSPDRPVLASTPAASVPAGSPVQVTLEGGVPGGRAFLYLTGGLLGAEVPHANRTWPAPLYLGVDFAAGFYGVQPLVLDGAGAWSASWVNPGLGGFTLGLQALVGTSLQGPLYGTSTPLSLVLQ